MDGKITIDGYYKGNGDYEVIHHGGKPDPEALCSLTYSINHNVEVVELLHTMKNAIERYIKADCQDCMINSINRALQEAGMEPLKESAIKVILDEIAFQEASQMTDDESGAEYMKGKVKNFNERGFGFIECQEADKDVFVHYSAIVGQNGRKELSKGQLVEFDCETDKQGRLRAINCQIIAG